MLIAQDFILLNLPKTGSAFTRHAIKKVHKIIRYDVFFRLFNSSKKVDLLELKLPNIRAEHEVFEKDEHGTYQQIPKEFLNSDREVISVVRDPIEAYLSRYYFKSYKLAAENNPEYQKLIYSFLPNFPEISFDEFVFTYADIYVKEGFKKLGLNYNKNVGSLTFQFIIFFAKNPIDFFKLIENIDIDRVDLKEHFGHVKFLFNEDLSLMIYDYLKGKNYLKRHINFIIKEKKINVTKRKDSKYDLLNEKNLNHFYNKEILLFKLFPNYKKNLESIKSQLK